jgi:hypothetical protein
LAQWQEFNSSVNNRLIEFVHPGEACYGATFKYEKCTVYASQTQNASYVREDPFLTDFSFWAGDPCPPPSQYGQWFGGNAASCNQGKYPDYAVAVENAQQVSKTIKFASKHNLRLVVKNTGHDFLGRNVGVGALSIWTRNLTGIEWIENWNANRSTKNVSLFVFTRA